MNNFKPLKDLSIDKIPSFHKNVLEAGSKLEHKKFLIGNNSEFLSQGHRSYKGGQSRNIGSNLTNAKSMITNLNCM